MIERLKFVIGSVLAKYMADWTAQLLDNDPYLRINEADLLLLAMVYTRVYREHGEINFSDCLDEFSSVMDEDFDPDRAHAMRDAVIHKIRTELFS